MADWLELLGLKQTFELLFAGELTTVAAEGAIVAAREVYPDTSQDYVEVLGEAQRYLESVRRIVMAQAQALADMWVALMDVFDEGVVTISPGLPRPEDRLLTPAELAAIEGISALIAAEVESRASDLEDATDEAEQLAQDLEDLQAEIEDAEQEVEDAAVELEDALEAGEGGEDDEDD